MGREGAVATVADREARVLRGVAAVYFIAFLAAFNQFPALLGDRGLVPAQQFIERTSSQNAPSLFRWRFTPYSDRKLRVVCVIGIVLSASVVLGLVQLGPGWATIPVFFVLWWFYLSIVNIGQYYYGFGWESLLLEVGFIVGFLGTPDVAPPMLILLFLRWTLFRVEFGAGMIKMRGDAAWRNLTAMDYHHQTQPMPNPLSRWAHQKPHWWHKTETLGSHVIQLVMPWLLFFPQPIASIAAVVIIFIPTVGDYITPALIGGPDGLMVSNLIQAQFGKANNWPLGAALWLFQRRWV